MTIFKKKMIDADREKQRKRIFIAMYFMPIIVSIHSLIVDALFECQNMKISYVIVVLRKHDDI